MDKQKKRGIIKKVIDSVKGSAKLGAVDKAYSGLKKISETVESAVSNANPMSKKNFFRHAVMYSGKPEKWKGEAKKSKVVLTK